MAFDPRKSNPLEKPSAAKEQPKIATELPPGTPSSPEAEATSRINAAIAQAKLLEQEIRTLEGRIKNRDPKLVRQLQAENAALRARLVILEKALFAVLSDALKPRTEAEFATQLQILNESAVEFFKQSNIDPEIWKNIAF